VFFVGSLFLLLPSLAFASFDTNLHLGSRGSAVTFLQQFLISQGLLSSENASGYFGKLTQKALIAFQRQQGITPASGFFGALTRSLVIAMQGIDRKQFFDSSQSSPSTSNNGNGSGQAPAWNAPTGGGIGGILYAQNLPSCQGTELFNSPLAVEGTYDSISPLGRTSANSGNVGHVVPVDHLYVNFKRTTPGDYSSPSLPATILAPGDIEIFEISTLTYEKDGKDIGSDYHLYFAPCREVTAYFGHATALSPKIQTALDHADQKSCGAPYSTGSPPNTIEKPCNYSLLLNLKSGEEIGTAGGPGVMTYLASFDFGVYDQRREPLPFVDPKYWTPLNLHAVCGLYYYPDGPIKTNLLKKIDNTKKDANGLPDCGTNMWDKAGTLQGNWVLPGTPTGRVPDMQGFVAMHLNTDPSQGLIDWGSGIAPADRIQFSFANSGVVNRDPADVKADGSIYCFQDMNHGTTYARSVILQLVDDNTLKAQYVRGACPSSPAFSNPTTYVR